MNVQILAATVSLVSLSWLGMSFATPADPADQLIYPVGPELTVSAEESDSHRLGAILKEEIELPPWDSRPGSSMELALVIVE